MFTITNISTKQRCCIALRNYSSQIRKVLIANRGEIACRISRTAKRLGIQTVAVYSDADAKALHVCSADEAYHIGPSASSESYLRSDKLLEVAKKAGCHAVHPGYGFLSENADFAEECFNNGIIFIGPPASAIRDMGCKSKSKRIMEAAGVPVIKGYHGDEQSDARLKTEAERIGYPVMLKALKGGGGKGMRVVLNSEKFDEQLASARNEASKAFGDTSMLVESYVSQPRHVEVQIFGDKHGNYVHMHERDCSVQRRHQKVIEEAPAPGLSLEVRKALGEAAIRAGRAVFYVGAGTVEFIVDTNTMQYFFMEMNTRLQVEHPVTEMITNLDLVELQFKIAAGEKLPLRQENIKNHGHSFETRIYAEDPDNGFLPQAGNLSYLRLPVEDDKVRVDTGVRPGDDVPVFYDPLIAKLIVWGENREEALGRLQRSLTAFNVAGVPTNINFLLALARQREFAEGKVHTNFIPQHESDLLHQTSIDRHTVGVCIASQLYSETAQSDPNDPFMIHSGFRVNITPVRTITLLWKGEPLSIKVTTLNSNVYKINYSFNEKAEEFLLHCNCQKTEDNGILVETNIDGFIERCLTVCTDSSIQVFKNDGVRSLDIPLQQFVEEEDEGDSASQLATSPMPGVVDQILVMTNDVVSKGQALVTVIAMKMEYTIRAPQEGTISELLCKSGDSVAKGDVLVRFQDSS